jgi:hypothetical protein
VREYSLTDLHGHAYQLRAPHLVTSFLSRTPRLGV